MLDGDLLNVDVDLAADLDLARRRSPARSPPTRTSPRRSTPPSRPTSARSTPTAIAVAQQDAIITQDIDGRRHGDRRPAVRHHAVTAVADDRPPAAGRPARRTRPTGPRPRRRRRSCWARCRVRATASPPALARRGGRAGPSADPAAAPGAARRRRAAHDRRGRGGGRPRDRPRWCSPTTSGSSWTPRCARWGCSAGRRERARAEAVGPAARAQVPPRRQRPARHPAADRAVRGAVQRRCSSCPVVLALRRGVGVGAVLRGARGRDGAGVRQPGAVRRRRRRSPCSRPASTSSATRPRPATAARRPARWAFGFYLFWPAFYTDVTDSYRLGRAGRVRTDLGGLYFNALVVLASFGVWWLTGWHAVLLIVATQVLQMIRQLAAAAPLRRLPRARRPHRRARPLPAHRPGHAGPAARTAGTSRRPRR